MLIYTSTLSSLSQKYPKHGELVNKPIANYAQMKTIFTPRLVNSRQLFEPKLLIKAIDYLADNKAEGSDYAKMTASERASWLRTLLRTHFD